MKNIDMKQLPDGVEAWSDGDVLLILSDNSLVLPMISRVDSVVTDPPYGLRFMGKKWDYDVPSTETWAACIESCKPGAHLLSFAGTRTQHRMATAIEDSGFEIRDMISWVYGTGFPKSMDISKAIDKSEGAVRETGPVDPVRAARLVNQSGKYETDAGWSAGNRIVTIDPPATDLAKQWSGWGTALKPAMEPITVARKPLIGTVAKNVEQYGTGGLNIDGCRVETSDNLNGGAYATQSSRTCLPGADEGLDDYGMFNPGRKAEKGFSQPLGRWPANLIHDGSEDVVELFPSSDNCSESEPSPSREGEASRDSANEGGVGFKMRPGIRRKPESSAARFFYCAKASRKERGENNRHPTVKPIELMRYLCRLVTPPGGVILDPFMGSGSTGVAAVMEGFQFIGIERDPESFKTAVERISSAMKSKSAA